MKILHPAGWPRPKGYSNGIQASGDMVFLAGLVAWDENEHIAAADFAGQARRIFANIVTLLAEAGAGPEHLVRLTWFVTDKQEYLSSGSEIGAAYREIIGRNYPAMAVVEVSGLIEAGAKLEIEATAVIPGR
ncbi:MAG: RidA family protein [Alphaproteobacteria bacterium]